MEYLVCRLREHPSLTTSRVCEKVAELLDSLGFRVNDALEERRITPEDVRSLPERFYCLFRGEELRGVAVTRVEGEVCRVYYMKSLDRVERTFVVLLISELLKSRVREIVLVRVDDENILREVKELGFKTNSDGHLFYSFRVE